MSVAAGSWVRFGLIGLLALALGALLLSPASPAGAQSGSGTVDYDTDGDNLIEVSNLAQLNAIRYDLDGNGTVASGDQANYDIAFPNALASMGCAATCTGYELEADLDFDTHGDDDAVTVADTYWNGGAGWEPLGDSGPSPFRTTFEGNNHTISNLFINVTGNSDNYIGLFGQLGGATVTRVHLVDAKVTGNNDVGALVGHITLGTVSHSSSSGTVSGVGKVGGLVGAINSSSGVVEYSRSSAVVTATGKNVGGLVGYSGGTVRVSYATGAVTGLDDVGGLAGYSPTSLYAVYATGAVTATGSSNAQAGGLVGASEGGIYASYSTGAVTSASGHAGGLLNPSGSGATVGHSYWDVTTTGIADDNNADTGVGKTTRDLQMPTQTDGYAGIYANWNLNLDGDASTDDDPWDFGTASQYPALKADSDGDGTPSAYEFGRQGRSAPAVTVDYDDDDDGLIEIATLDQLNAMRWDLDGDGAPDVANANDYALAFPNPATGMGCPDTDSDAATPNCTGYELAADLDFNTDKTGSSAAVVDSSDAYWNGGAGWQPIGSDSSASTRYNAVFDGDGHTISNLFISRSSTNDVGLFGASSATSAIRNVGLESASVTGNAYTGALIGSVYGAVEAAYSTGSVNGNGYVGGLVASLSGGSSSIQRGYSTASVTGSTGRIGGLVGSSSGGGQIKASYATGAVRGIDYVGGLAGDSDSNGGITASYATGAVSSSASPAGTNLGGLAGRNTGTITNSYWNVTTSGIADDNDAATGEGKTTSDLQSPAQTNGYAGIYANWNLNLDSTAGGDDPWDFGTASQYPALKADFNRDGVRSAVDGDFGRQPRSAPVDYDTDGDNLIEVSTLAQLNAIRHDLDGNGDSTHAAYTGAFLNAASDMGCAATCLGYELTADLDFDENGDSQMTEVGDPTYWNTGSGWAPIGGIFTAIFNGNGHVIKNLFINRSGQGNVGLFGTVESRRTIGNLGLENVNITGGNSVGPLAGTLLTATVERVYATGSVTGRENTGGLVGFAGYSFTLHTNPTLRNTYSRVAVTGTDRVSGLVGYVNEGLTLTNSYFAGTISGTGADVGSLVGRALGVTAARSYWDGDRASGAGGSRPAGASRTTSELQTPTGATGIYSGWSAAIWDFGTASQYPALKYDTNEDSTVTWQEFGSQVRSAPANNPPTFTAGYDDTPNIAEGETAVGNYAATDPESDALTYAVTGTDAAAFAISGAGVLTLNSAANHETKSSYIVSVTVHDGKDAAGAADTSVDATLDLTVTVDDTLEPPGVPTGVNVVGIVNGLRVSWTAADAAGKPAVSFWVQYAQRTSAGPPPVWDSLTLISAGGVTTYDITGLTPGETYQVFVRGVNDEGNSPWTLPVQGVPLAPPVVPPGTVDYDTDDDGLIEVDSLVKLNAVRWDLDGNGASANAGYATAFPNPETGMGCPVTTTDADDNDCTGYELTADLDFDTHGNDDTVTAADTYWNGGAGWAPIGSSGAPFATTFDGAGHAISNLFINRGSTDYLGLFRVVGDGGRIRNLGLERVKITGRDFIGAVAGETSAFSGVEAVYVTGAVSGRDLIGGLIGEHHPNASLRNTYSAARVTGSSYVGGLLGYVPSSNATVYYSYARGVVTGRNSGGLLYPSADQWGINGQQTYWDTQTTGQATSNGGTGQTTSNLKSPTGATGIYSDWPTATWDFGTAIQYPALKYDTDGDGAASWQEFGRQPRSAPVVALGTVDYDTDDDGLIEVDSLVKLNAVRWDLDGNGASANAGYATAFPNPETGMGCPFTATDADDNDCTGYELTADLDFDQNNDNRITSADAAWWNGGSGWEPIGGNSLASVTSGYPGFTATFQGNGHTISHLYIDRPGRNAVGLFGATKGRNSVIRNLTLADVNVASKRNVGALVGSSWGSIEGVHVSGRVSGDRAGGLVGQLSGRASRSHSEAVVTGGSAGNRLVSSGGLVSVLTGSVESSYATGSVTGTYNVGGLVGFMDEDGRVSRCYATGDVTVSVTNGGGLIGLNNSGSISACYATGEVSGNGNIAGGLVGLSRNPSGNRGAIVASYARGRVTATGSRTGGLGGKGGASVTNSYWDVTTSGIADDNNAATGEGKATSELQSPTQTNGYAGIYANWNLDLDGDANTDDDPWDFGTTSEYPALKADFNDDGISTWQEFGRQRRSAPVVQPPVVAPGTVDYDTDGDNLIEVDSLAKLNAMRWDADGDGAGGGSGYDAAFPDAAPGMGCPSDCTGYELEADLNFDTNGRVGADSGDDYWNGGMGWAPFQYYGIFEGNRHTISNLYVNRPSQDYVGLFSTAGAYAEASEVRNVGLENVDVSGREYVGGLAGRAYGSVRRVYTTGEVNGEHYVGGLVGEARSLISETYSKADVSGDGWESSNVGGLVGYLRLGTVKASYATGDVSGMNWVGGLVGHNSSLDDGGIIASYATGNLGFGGLEDADPPPGRWVDGFSSRYYLPYTPTWVGGLVGDSSGPVVASYSTGGHPISLAGFQPGERKDRSRRDLAYMMEVHWKVGGLIGKSYGRDEHDSYWDIVTSRHRPGDKDWVYGKGKTTEELQWVTGYTGIYADWNVDLDGDGFGDDPWDFGSSAHYPTLKVDWDGDGTATSYEFGGQGRSLNDHVPPVAVGGTGMFEVTVPENTPSGAPIFGVTLPLAPADASSYNLFIDAQWPDGAHFNLDGDTGQLSAWGALDYESKDTYRLGITAVATDGARHSNRIIIRVTDVAEPPGPPTGVTIVPGKGSLEVFWTAPDMAGKPPLRIYEVTYYHDGDKAKITAAGTTTYTMTHLTPLITYAVQVRARNVDGWGPDSAVVLGTPYWFAPSAAATGAEPGTQRFRRSAPPPPGQPASLRATPQADGSALVTWDAPTEAGDDAFYRVRRRVDAADGSYQVIARRVEAVGSDGVVAYRDDGNGREAGQRYLYSVRAFDGDGKPLGRWTQGVRDNRPPAFAEDSAAAFEVAENTAAGADIGSPVTAADPDDGDTLVYLLGGADADHFAIDPDSGQLRTSGALDYESKDSYAVTVIAADGAGLWAGLDATITVTDMEEAPAFAAASATRQVAENTAAGTNIGSPVTATDSDGDALTYSLGSTAAAHFTIDSSSGQLQTSGALDYESTDSYALTVTATDGGGLTASIAVTITVDDIEEAGRPGNVQAALQADGSVLVTWQAPAGAGADTFYRVRRRVDTADSGYQLIARRVEDTDNDGDAEYRDEGGDLEAGQSYIYSVRAFAGSGAKLGPWTEGVSVAIPAAAPAEKEKRAANAAPSFSDSAAAVSVAENTAAGTNIGDAVAATDSDGDSLTYTLGTTTDDAHFAIDSKTGQLQTRGALDYEGKNTYAVTVTATDGGGLSASIAVTVKVTDVADTTPGQPDAPEISNIKETSFRVTWTAPSAGSSAISGYGIQYKLSSEADSAYADVKPTPTGTVTGYNLVDRNGQAITAGTS